MKGEKMIRRILVLTAVMISVFVGMALGASQQTESRMDLPQPDIPEPQFFCGYCHILTYPGILQKSFDTWEKSKHNKTFCVQCHYPPKDIGKGKTPWAGTAVESKHIPKKPPERFAYVPLGGETVRTRPMILDASCMTADCHGKPDDKFKTKKIQFTEKVSFVHQPHFDKKNQIEGQQVNCTSCHQHETEMKHFEVTKDTCHVCHFTNAKFNEGRGKCELCHVLPKKPIQTSGEKPITHEMLKTAKVPCGSCHYELIQASDGGEFQVFFENGELKTTLVLGAGRIKKESCLACHDQELEIKEAGKQELMHRKHVTKKTARCLDCHQPIKHAKADLEKPVLKGNPNPDLNDSMPYGCKACHIEPHRYQRLLSAGPKREGVAKTPDFMYKARTNCLGCHVEKGATDKGGGVMRASGKTCVSCHTKDHDKMLKDWETELSNGIKETLELEQEAQEVLAKFKSKLPKDDLAEFKKMLREGKENLNIVRFGNGVHNKKYSMFLLDAAMVNFEDVIDELEEGE
jgi:hypothetical protein